MIIHLACDDEILDTLDVAPAELPALNAEANELGLFYITEQDREEAERLEEMRQKKTEGLSARDLGEMLGWMLPVMMALGEHDEEKPFIFSHPRNGYGL